MFSILANQISLTRGDTFKASITITRNGETYTPQSGDEIHFYLKRDVLNSNKTEYVDTTPLIEKTIDKSTMLLYLEPEDTAELGFGKYVYDLELTFANGEIDTFINAAKFNLLPEVGSVTEDEGE